MGRDKFWTDERIEELKKLSKTMSDKELGEHFDKSAGAIEVARHRNKIDKPKFWTDEKLEEFKMLYPTVGNEELAEHFKVTVASIEAVCARLKLKKVPGLRGDLIAKSRIEREKNIKKPKVRERKYYTYIHAPNHPKAHHGYVQKHILVMEGHLGRHLAPNEFISFKDGDKKNTSIDNLELHVNLMHDMSDKNPKYKDIDAEYLLGLRKAGHKVKDICKDLDISIELFYKKIRTISHKYKYRKGAKRK